MTIPIIPGLQPSVVAALPALFGQWEGSALPFMYTDSKGYVTTGTGNLIDPVGSALALPWKNADGSLAASGDVAAAFDAVKSAWPGVQSVNGASLTTIRLDKDGLDQLLYKTIAANQAYFMAHVPGFAALPADAQMVYHSLAWAWGPGFASVWGGNGTAFNAAIAAGNFSQAATILKTASEHEESINPGIVPRDDASVAMLANAATVAAHKGDYTKFYYPAIAPVSKSYGKYIAAAVGGVGGFLLGGPIGAAIGIALGGGGGTVINAAKAGTLHIGASATPPPAPDPKKVQAKLNSLGMASPPLAVDGLLGPLSEAAIKTFQTSKKIAATGVLDAATIKALGV